MLCGCCCAPQRFSPPAEAPRNARTSSVCVQHPAPPPVEEVDLTGEPSSSQQPPQAQQQQQQQQAWGAAPAPGGAAGLASGLPPAMAAAPERRFDWRDMLRQVAAQSESLDDDLSSDAGPQPLSATLRAEGEAPRQRRRVDGQARAECCIHLLALPSCRPGAMPAWLHVPESCMRLVYPPPPPHPTPPRPPPPHTHTAPHPAPPPAALLNESAEAAALARRKALLADQQQLQFAAQAHTALEQSRPERAQRLEAEAAKARPCRVPCLLLCLLVAMPCACLLYHCCALHALVALWAASRGLPCEQVSCSNNCGVPLLSPISLPADPAAAA